MKVERYDQRSIVYHNRERCCEQLAQPFVTDKPYYRCKRNATYLIDGVPYCTHHGGQRALEHLVEKNDI